MPLTFGSLFAGIGGFDLGFIRAGMKCVAQVEREAAKLERRKAKKQAKKRKK